MLAYKLFMAIIALILLVVSAISVLCAKQKLLQLKAELHKLAGGCLLSVADVVQVMDTLLRNAILDQGSESYRIYLAVSTYGIFLIQVLATLAVIALLLTFGRIVKKKAESEAAA